MSEPNSGSRLREILAAIGVVLSLVFVGYELRQNTQVSKAAAIQGLADQSLDIILTWTSDGETVHLLTRVLAGETPDTFTADENTKIRLMFLAILRNAESRHRQTTLGILEDPTILGGAASIWRTPYLAERWPVLRESVAPDFAEAFELEYGLR